MAANSQQELENDINKTDNKKYTFIEQRQQNECTDALAWMNYKWRLQGMILHSVGMYSL